MNKRSLLVSLALLATLAGCDDDDKKKRLESMGTPKPSAPPPWASAASSAPAPEASAAPEAPVKLTGDKKLRDRLQGGKWFRKVTPAQEAENKAELEKAEAALKNAKNEGEKRAAKARKTTVEEITLSWTEFSPKKRTTKAPPNRLVLERPYEVIKEENNQITIRVWDEVNPQGGLEFYTFLGDDSVKMVQGDSTRFEILERKK